jgi:hypothetical protein
LEVNDVQAYSGSCDVLDALGSWVLRTASGHGGRGLPVEFSFRDSGFSDKAFWTEYL